MTSDDLREIFKNACTAEPLAEGWPELEKFGKAVIDACIGVCEGARDCADFNKMAMQEDGSPYYDHDKLDVVISALEDCITTMRFNAEIIYGLSGPHEQVEIDESIELGVKA